MDRDWPQGLALLGAIAAAILLSVWCAEQERSTPEQRAAFEIEARERMTRQARLNEQEIEAYRSQRDYQVERLTFTFQELGYPPAESRRMAEREYREELERRRGALKEYRANIP